MTKIWVKAVIFDYGNTLVLDPFDDVLKLKVSEVRQLLKREGYAFRKEEIIYDWRRANEEVNYPHIAHFAQEEPIIEEMLRRLGVKERIHELSQKILQVYREGYEKILSESSRRKEIKAILEDLRNRGKKLAVFSNGRKLDVETALELYEVSEYFEFILSSEELGVEKPDPHVFKTIIQRIKEPSENIVYVGDDPVRDVVGAKKLGMKAILYIPPKNYRKSVPWRKYDVEIPEELKPDAKIRDLQELKKLII